jgi:predicted GNAT superfamily acetyltransferase
MHTTELYGGVTLGAFVNGRLVGFSYALPGFDGTPFLLSCGLAVASGFESRGIGLALKLAQARAARHAGYREVRWTTNAIASRPLRLYLSKLGGRLVRYRPDMYAGVFPTLFPDEVEVRWEVAHPVSPPTRPGGETPHPLIISREDATGCRLLVGVEDEARAPVLAQYSVEIPWDRAALARDAPGLARPWVMGVRAAMQALLSEGYSGTGVLRDLATQRSFVVFSRGEPDGPEG